MAKTENGRGRLLCLLEILQKETDEQHGLSAQELLSKLEARGFPVERKALYRDFDALNASAIPLESTGRPPRYYIEEREFELEEIMILIDAVESAGFMTETKKAGLIKKLKGLTSTGKASELNEQIHYLDRHHSSNNEFIYSVAAIRRAMAEGHPVTFQYIEYDIDAGEVLKHDGMQYILHPFAMVWNNGFYYCIGARPEQSGKGDEEKIVHFRIDRMKAAKVDAKRKLVKPPKGFSVARHTESSFSMFGSEPEVVTIRFGKNLLTQFYDRFSRDVVIQKDPKNPEFLLANVSVSVAPTFFAWISQYEGAFTIEGPEHVRQKYHDHLKKALDA
ncbi:MAG: WYL domain-containing protein [Clostridiales bacterium]|nr:WYL domain-containing protein [Clostridiales bacterium]